jgi:hypothetical protein
MIFRVPRQTRGLVFTLVAFALTLVAMDAFAFPSARRNPGMVWSGEAGGIILFGGLTTVPRGDGTAARYEYNDTWIWTGLRWARIYSESSPEPRFAMAMVYDSNRKQIVMFGGAQGTTLFGDTWVFRGGDWTWVDTPNAPAPRRYVAAAFDPVRDRVVLYGGGLGEDPRFFDTWEFDGTTWTLIRGDGPRVESPSLVYDAARNEVLMVGLESDEVVMYRYASSEWTRVEPETLPSCAGQASMAFREHDGRVMIYGGVCDLFTRSNKTWLWDGTDWSELQLASPTASAGPRFGYGLAYDRERSQAILYGGVGFLSTEHQDTFKLGADRWHRIDTRLDPGPRTQFVFVPDESRGTVWFFGGQNAVNFFSDLWRLENLRWVRVPVSEGPGFCDRPLGAIDPQRDRLVVICNDSRTWEFDGTAWEEKEASTRPRPRSWSSVVYEPNLRKIVLYGGLDLSGQYLDETWTWDGTEWKKLDIRSKDRPRARMLAQMFWDPASSRIILHGGVGFPTFRDNFQRYEDQWTFDGSKWVEMSPSTKLPHRYGSQVATDPRTGHIMVFGGKDNQERFVNDIWTWNGSNWSQQNVGPAPAPRMNGRMALDPSTGKVVLYGGYAGIYYSELWTFDGSWTRIEDEPPVRRRPTRPGSNSALGPSEAGLVSLEDETFDGSGTRIEDEPSMRPRPAESGFNPLLSLPEAGSASAGDAVR